MRLIFDFINVLKFRIFLKEMLVFSAETHKMPIRASGREDPDQSASSEAVCSWSVVLFVKTFLWSTSVLIRDFA